jgi:hypothetical protein
VKARAQRGSSSLAFVLLLFSLGMLMLNGLQRQLSQQQATVASEIGFLKQYSGAISALAWGSRQSWQATGSWSCQNRPGEWRACVLRTEKGESLMAAQMLSGKDKSPVTHYRWGEIKDSRWQAKAHGWVDFCPLPEVSQCLLPQ